MRYDQAETPAERRAERIQSERSPRSSLARTLPARRQVPARAPLADGLKQALRHDGLEDRERLRLLDPSSPRTSRLAIDPVRRACATTTSTC
jgi:hypothetical protein